jgi:hypothetical protein
MIEKTRKVLRTVVQILIGLLAAVPLVAPVLGAGRTAAAYAVAVGVAAVVTRAMHSVYAAPLLRWLGLSVEGGDASAGGGSE